MTLCGYGKILDVNLSTGEITRREVEAEFARNYLGGMGFGCKILWDETIPGVDPLGPDNLVMFANGPLTGTAAPCSGRTEITTRSPLTGNIGTGNTGGLWGARLKHAGFDVVVVRGRAQKPVYLWINDASVEVKEAGHLWGRDAWETSDMLPGQPGNPEAVSVLCIGTAGENLVRYACPVNDYHHVAARNGAGAVMGSKNLKAIAVRGTGTVRIARPQAFQEACREARDRVVAAKRAEEMPGGPRDARVDSLLRGCMQGKNYQTGVVPQWLETRSIELARKYPMRKEATCYACPISCFDLVTVNEGKYAGTQVNRALMPGVVMDWGANCAIASLPAIWKCKELCHRLGMDYVSASGTLAFAMELFQRGIIDAEYTGGLELSWGNEGAIIAMLHRIASREGFGDVLAEGSVRAAAAVGKGAERYVMTIKGAEMMVPDPRAGRRGWLFGSLTNPRGGDNIKNTHCHAERYNANWWVDKFDMFEDVKAKIYNMPPEEIPNTWQGKPTMTRWFEDLYSAVNSLGLCFFPAGFQLALGPTHLAKLFSACTGWDTSPREMMKLGEKVFTLFKAHAVRQGFSRKDDTWPEKFFTEPMPEGPAKGAVLSRETIDMLLDEYYDIRGWDRKSGVPTPQKLSELGLASVAGDLATGYHRPPCL
ncbi:MAG: aldehyde ferredoxin oxidoreductase family protein [Chloroflexi bacterium]|nr:aldehyde ferredoxin oxidoreductase family protein [Chloroflexota bacterium]